MRGTGRRCGWAAAVSAMTRSRRGSSLVPWPRRRTSAGRCRRSARVIAPSSSFSRTKTVWWFPEPETSEPSAGIFVSDRQDDVSDLLVQLHVPGGLDDLLEWVASIDDCAVFPGFHEFLEEEHVLLRELRRQLEHHLSVADPGGPRGQHQVLQSIRRKEDAPGFERSLAAREQKVAD